ncbi:NADPH:quinone reductase-like Zn-dependent oxidoreductase [Methanohalophilus levihalophilus]|uniref:NAD(P)-dependent alcohol dehydrogenase n=1 Tax=Methanohalophilus levihalophilus TaxID=1431282 RepID=UPI001AE11A50|nr:NAD(P)-dependent alcohol dehydrogenase [Methanohalophilus levihalophilus]MBP2029252.1 NADPH:quinone reductase-like Zn-dependent oxidoreductase [Methanohalophilus levihalophilus]
MKAVVNERYGSPDVLELKEVPKPIPKDNEILIKIHATTVNRTDCGFRNADPFFVRFFLGITKPKQKILGSEFAGAIESIGRDVTLFQVGDKVFGHTGDKMGAHAEYICLAEDDPIAIKPENLDYEEAASICDGASLALTYISRSNLQKGKRILIYGASGSIGTAAVQLAKYYGAEVTAVCSTTNLEMVKSLDADRVIDYTQEDFTKDDQTHDIVFDAVGKSSFSRCKSLLKKGGIYFSTELGFLAQNPLLHIWTSKIGSKKVMFPLPKYTREDVAFFRELIEEGKLKPVIDRKYPLEQIVDAYRYVEKGHKKGNVVITVGKSNNTE